MKSLITLGATAFLTTTFASHGTILMSELIPNGVGADPANTTVELSGGTPGASFTGALITIEGDPNGFQGGIDRFAVISGTFDANGLLGTTVPDYENPSFTFVLLEGSGANLFGLDVDTDNDGIADVTSFTGYTVLDALGVPDSTGDLVLQYGTDFGGQDFTAYIGDEPQLVFRDGSVGQWFAIDDPVSGVFDLDANPINAGDFDVDPTITGFTLGALNPTIVPEPSAFALMGLSGLMLLRRRH